MDRLKTEIEIYLKRKALKSPDTVTRREIVNRFRVNGAAKVSATLEALEASGTIKSYKEDCRTDGRGGRPRIRYQLT